MIQRGLDLHHRNSYIRALTDEGELLKSQRIYHNEIDRLWQYLSQFDDKDKRVVSEATMRLQIGHWLELIDLYEKKTASIERKLYSKLVETERWRKDLAILETMPGWRKLTALTVLAELGDYHRFRFRSSVRCFAGLVPSSKRSDKSCRYGKITKRGSTGIMCRPVGWRDLSL